MQRQVRGRESAENSGSSTVAAHRQCVDVSVIMQRQVQQLQFSRSRSSRFLRGQSSGFPCRPRAPSPKLSQKKKHADSLRGRRRGERGYHLSKLTPKKKTKTKKNGLSEGEEGRPGKRGGKPNPSNQFPVWEGGGEGRGGEEGTSQLSRATRRQQKRCASAAETAEDGPSVFENTLQEHTAAVKYGQGVSTRATYGDRIVDVLVVMQRQVVPTNQTVQKTGSS